VQGHSSSWSVAKKKGGRHLVFVEFDSTQSATAAKELFANTTTQNMNMADRITVQFSTSPRSTGNGKPRQGHQGRQMAFVRQAEHNPAILG
jgi:hypothetical protein